MSMQDFELACPSDAPQRHVASFFGSNAEYLRLHARPPAVCFRGEFEVGSLVALLTDPRIDRADDRRTAVELQLSDPVPMKAPYVRALILPDELPQARFVQDFLQSANGLIDVQTYELTPLKPAREYQALIEQKVIALQKSWGLE